MCAARLPHLKLKKNKTTKRVEGIAARDLYVVKSNVHIVYIYTKTERIRVKNEANWISQS